MCLKETRVENFNRQRLAGPGLWGSGLESFCIVHDQTDWVVTCGRNDRVLANGVSTVSGISGTGGIGDLHVRKRRREGGICLCLCVCLSVCLSVCMWRYAHA